MRKLFAFVVLATGCADDLSPAWRLDQARIVAVKMDPPHIVAGEVARIHALIASPDGTTSEVDAVGASAPFAPAGLFTAVHFNLDHWQIDGPPEAQLDQARSELGLGQGEPVPITVTLQFPGRLFADKVIFFGDSRANPAVPRVTVGGMEPTDDVVLANDDRVELLIEADASERIRWLTSCGSLDDDDKARATLHVDERCTGELAVVVRDAFGGVAWRVWSIRSQ